MKIRNTCEDVRLKIESIVIGTSDEDRSSVNEHIQSCNPCREYLAELEALQEIRTVRYALPDHERIKFSARVRTRIEQKKSASKQRGFIARPAFQIAAMLLIIVSVTFYMFNTTGPEQLYVFYDDDIEMIDAYSIYYESIIFPDDALVMRLYAETIFDDDVELNEYIYSDYYGFDYYNGFDQLSPEEIDYIIQRMEGV